MRKRLHKLKGNFIEITAVIGDKSVDYKGNDTILLVDVRSIDGKFLTDHTWVSVIMDNVHIGDKIIACGYVENYVKKDYTESTKVDINKNITVFHGPPTQEDCTSTTKLRLKRSLRSMLDKNKSIHQKIHNLSHLTNKVCRVEGILYTTNKYPSIKNLRMAGSRKILVDKMSCNIKKRIGLIPNNTKITALAKLRIPSNYVINDFDRFINGSKLEIIHLETKTSN